ncbi:MAG: hypothetical protein JXA04_10685 [Gammaproteobacteria bacterium]|nr:hypothetical protein [Gammaproteobacteria bacterium]
MSDTKFIRSEIALSVLESMRHCMVEYQTNAGAEKAEVACPMILFGYEVLVNELGPVEGLKSIRAMLEDFERQVGQSG